MSEARRRRLQRGAPPCLLGFSVLRLLGSCTPPPQPAPPPPPVSVVPPPPPPRRPFVEETLPSADKPYVIIVGTNQSESEDRQSVFVEGTLHNQGTGPTKQIQVKVEALDEAGHVVTTATALPTPQVLQPEENATFVVRFPNDSAVRSYHVEAEIH